MMNKFSTWMLLSFAVIFWILRIIATYCSTMGIEFIIQPLEMNTEIVLLFVALICFVFIGKRQLLGVIVYIVAYEGYFGFDIYKNMNSIISNTMSPEGYISIFFSFIGMILPILLLFDWLFDKNKQLHPTDKKTDWFYKNKEYDRKMDERSDKNNYRTL